MTEVGSTPRNEPRWPDPAWVTYATGRRISIRLDAGRPGPTGGPAYRDVVGVLEASTPAEWSVRTRANAVVTVESKSVVAAKVVPDSPGRLRTASDIDIASLEVIAADGWQPLEREPLGDWMLRAAHGFTGRANSVLPIGDPGLPLDSAIEAVQAWYAARSLPAMFQMPLPLRTDLDQQLTARGWDHYNPTQVMVCDLDRLRMSARPGDAADDAIIIATSSTPDTEWINSFRYRGMPLLPDVAPILTRNEHPVFIAVRGQDGATCAIGRGAITDQWLGITALEVAEPFRRRGMGRQIIAELAAYASSHSVRHVYLQVAQDNTPAMTLYERLGFEHHHDYVYRRWVAG
ncbi:MAG: GNAT family N-acetyltransferase [Actinomycetes bacterium]